MSRGGNAFAAMAATDVERASHLGDGQRNETNTTDRRTTPQQGRETQTVVVKIGGFQLI